MILSVKKVVAMSIIVSLLGAAGTFGLKTLTSKEVTGSVEAETTYGPIKLTVRLDKNTFRLGEMVNVTITITNISNETILLVYDQIPTTDFAVYNSSSDIICLYSTTRVWGAVGENLALEPSASYGKTWKWDQQRFVGEHYDLQPVVLGTYYITGRTGRVLNYLGPKDEYHEGKFYGRITVETPKIEIQIL